jgi:hypothetical protein
MIKNCNVYILQGRAACPSQVRPFTPMISIYICWNFSSVSIIFNMIVSKDVKEA